MIKLEKGRYISRIYFVGDGESFDMLGCLWRQLPSGHWKLDYRFRYYKDDQAHDSVDEKSGWGASFDGAYSEGEVVKKVDAVIRKLAEAMPALRGAPAGSRYTLDTTVIESDEPAVAIERMRGKPYFHMKFEE
jgi:hypothetical protein